MDPSPLPKNRRLTPEQFEGATKDLSAETIGIRYDRLTWFINRIVEASLAALPREFRRRWNGHVGIDATPIKAYSGYDHCTFTAKNGKTVVDKVITKASDPDAGPYARDVDHRDPSWPDAKPGRKVKKAVYAHEASLVIMGPDGPNDDDGTFPYLFVAMAPLHRPGADPGGNGIAALASMVARGYPTGLAAGDRAYTSAMPEKYAYPARALGFELVLDYKDDQLGVMGEWAGALFIEGAFYCPSIPPKLIAATIDYRGGRITEDVWQSRLAARAAYEMRPNQREVAETSNLRPHPNQAARTGLGEPAAGLPATDGHLPARSAQPLWPGTALRQPTVARGLRAAPQRHRRRQWSPQRSIRSGHRRTRTAPHPRHRGPERVRRPRTLLTEPRAHQIVPRELRGRYRRRAQDPGQRSRPRPADHGVTSGARTDLAHRRPPTGRELISTS